MDMNTTGGIWVPSYYRRRHPFLWVRAAGGPQTVDWVAGGVLAALVLGLCALAHAPHRQVAPSAVVIATPGAQASETNADRVAYAPTQTAAVNK